VEADSERRLRSERVAADADPLSVAETARQELAEHEGDVAGLVDDVLDRYGGGVSSFVCGKAGAATT
jgi:hypothetical protein